MSAKAAVAKTFSLICGTDDFLVSRKAKALYDEKSAGCDDQFGREVVDGAAGVVDDVENAMRAFRGAISTMPLFGDRKVVWFKDVTFLGDNRVGKTEAAKTAAADLCDLLGNLDPGSLEVIISAFPVDRRRKEYKNLGKIADLQFLGGDKKDGSAVEALVDEECARLQVRISPSARELLIARISGNTRLVLEELRKLANYLGEPDAVIEEALVNDLVPVFGEGDYFETAEAFFARDLEWTLDAVRRHFFYGYDARGLITNLQGRCRLAIQLRVLMDSGAIQPPRGWGKLDLSRAANLYQHHFGESGQKSGFNVFTQHPFYAKRIMDSTVNFTLRNLVDIQSELLRAFEETMTRSGEEEQVIRDMAVRCLGRG